MGPFHLNFRQDCLKTLESNLYITQYCWENFRCKMNIESVQYNAALAITGAISGFSKEKPCQVLVIESLKPRRWYQKLCLFFKLKKMNISYVFDIIPEVLSTRITRNHHNIPLINVKHEHFRNFLNFRTLPFFPSTVIEWKYSTIIFQIRNLIMLLKNKSWNLSGKVLVERLMRIIVIKFNCVNTNLG